MAYAGTDFYQLDDLLSEEQILLRDTVRKWVDDKVLPVIERFHDDAKFPHHLTPEMAELGLFGPALPEKYGGMGLDSTAYGLIMQELERGDSGLRSAASVQGALVMYPIFAYGSEEQKLKWLPELAKGKKIGCFGLTEPDAGSDPASMKTRAVKDGNHYVLNGAKMWITNGTVADVAVVWAKVKDENDEIRGFLVEKGAPGFTAPEQKGKYSLRASVTSELVLHDVKVGLDAMLPNVKGLKGPLGCLTQARYGIAWGVLGAAMACYEASVKYSKERIMFGKPIGAFQLTQKKLAEMLTEITKGQLLAWRLSKLKDAGTMKPHHVSMAKRNNCAIALDIAREARGLHGANGITNEYPIMRHMMNLESVYTYEGTHEMHTLVLGEWATGIPAYRV